MIELYSPDSEAELLILRSILVAAEIPHFVHNDTFGSLVAGPRIALYNRKKIFVPEIDRDEAEELLAEFLRKQASPLLEPRRSYTLRDKARMVLEVLLFGWFLPGKRFRPAPIRLVKGARDEE